MRKYLSAAVCLILICSISIAQYRPASIIGSIKTSDGQPAADVSVHVPKVKKGAVSAADGTYEIRRLEPGVYVLEISLVGYTTQSRQVSLSPGERESVNIQLELSSSELNEVTVRSAHTKYTADQLSSSLRLQSGNIQIPQNVQVVTSQAIRDQQILDISEGLTRNVSGATYSADESWGNYSNIMARGGRITALRNGLNVKMPWGPLLEDMSMVDRVEFVKGPAGFMFANAEPTGLYNVVTKKPTGVEHGEASVTLGSFDTYRSAVDLDGKLSGDGRLLYRINLMGQLKNSHRDYDFNNRYSVVPVLTYRLNEKTSVTAEYTYQNIQMAMLGSSYLFSLKMGDLPATTSMLEPNLDPTKMREHNVYLSLDHQLADRWKFTTKLGYLNYMQEGASIWPSYPAGLAGNGDLIRSIANWDAAGQAKLGQMFINGDLVAGGITHRILGGLDVSYKNYFADFYQFFDITGYDNFGNSIPFNIYNPVHGFIPTQFLPKFDRSLPLRQRGAGTMGESSSSVYLQDELRFAKERVRLTLAGRYTTLKQHSFGTYSNDKKFTPRIGLSVSVANNLAIYGLYDQSFVAQQGMDSANKPFIPLTGTNIEAGVKKQWFGGKWNTTVSVYNITRNNLISYIPGPEFKAIQTGQTRTRGAEVDLAGEILPALNAIVNYAYNTAEITKDEDPTKIGGPVDGPGFPKHISNAWLTYQLRLNKTGGLGFSAGYQFMAGRPHDLPDYSRIDAGVHWVAGQLRLGFLANNLFDRYVYTGAPFEYNNDYSSTEYYFVAEPGINFRITAAYRW